MDYFNISTGIRPGFVATFAKPCGRAAGDRCGTRDKKQRRVVMREWSQRG